MAQARSALDASNWAFSHPSPYYQCNRFLVPFAWGLMARRGGFTSHKGVTLSVFAKSGSLWTFQARAYTLQRSFSTKYNQNSRKSVWRTCKWKSSGPGENDREDGMDLDLENCAYLGQISRSAINYRGMRFRAKNFFPSALQVDWNTQHQKN